MTPPFIPHNEMAARRGIVPSLDGLRAISILLVLGAHFIDERLFPGGLGVCIFFVISGFLITRLLLAEYKAQGSVSIRLFYLRRVIRLYPVILVFAASMIAAYILIGRSYNLREPASALFYFANYLYVYFDLHNIPASMPFGVFWSLSVEEHFYILFPVIFIWLNANPGRLLAALIGLCVFCLGLRLVIAGFHPDYLDTNIFYMESQYRLDSIAYGVVLALACELKQGQRIIHALARPSFALAALGVILGCLLIRNPWFRETIRYTVLGCSIDILIATVLFSSRLNIIQTALNGAILVWIGRLSYSIYVWHEGVASFMPLTGWPTWEVAALKLAVTAVVATASYYVVEQPFLRLRRLLATPQPVLPPQPAYPQLHANTGV